MNMYVCVHHYIASKGMLVDLESIYQIKRIMNTHILTSSEDNLSWHAPHAASVVVCVCVRESESVRMSVMPQPLHWLICMHIHASWKNSCIHSQIHAYMSSRIDMYKGFT